MKTFAVTKKGEPGQCFEVPEIVYDWIYAKGYRDGKEEGELLARQDLCAARLELAALRLERLRASNSSHGALSSPCGAGP